MKEPHFLRTLPQSLPFSNIRVLDLSRLLPGPFATKLLGDLGAQVDKLEDPNLGDYLRHMPPLGDDGVNPAFELLNAQKRSLVLDLKSDQGRRDFFALLPSYDVLLESFRPGVMDRLGLGNDALKKAHPTLISCGIRAFGDDGPLRQRAGHDLGCVARSGALSLFGQPGKKPNLPGVQIADIGSGIFAALRISAALYQNTIAPDFRPISISMMSSAAAFAAFGFGTYSHSPRLPGTDVLTGDLAVYNIYACKDARFVALASLEPKFWKRFCEASGFETDVPKPLEPGPQQDKLRAQLETFFVQRTRDEWSELADEADCCLEPILEPMELLRDAQAKALELIGAGPSLSTPAGRAQKKPAPTHGQHTREILEQLKLT